MLVVSQVLFKIFETFAIEKIVPNPSANIDDASSAEDLQSDIPWRRRTTMLKTKGILEKLWSDLWKRFFFQIWKKTKKEGINPLGLAAVTLILGCILGCPYRALDWSHLNYFDLAMVGKFKNVNTNYPLSSISAEIYV